MSEFASFRSAIVVMLRYAWWKILLLALLSGWWAVTNVWFGSTFFVAIIFGVVIGMIVQKTLFTNNVPLSFRYVVMSFGTACLFVYLHFVFYSSMNYFENMIFPWQIWAALQTIARTGSDVGGYVIAGSIRFQGNGYYTQWMVESTLTLISATATTHLKT